MATAGRNRNLVETIGAKALAAAGYFGGMAMLIGSTFRWALRGMFSGKVRFGRPALITQMVRVGVRSAGIVILVQLFIGVILQLQMTPPLADLKQLSG